MFEIMEKNNSKIYASAFMLFGALALIVTIGVIFVILFEQRIPIMRKIFVTEFVGILGSLLALWLIMSLRGKKMEIIGNEIDVAMIAFILIVLFLIFGNV